MKLFDHRFCSFISSDPCIMNKFTWSLWGLLRGGLFRRDTERGSMVTVLRAIWLHCNVFDHNVGGLVASWCMCWGRKGGCDVGVVGLAGASIEERVNNHIYMCVYKY